MRDTTKNASSELRRAETGRANRQGRPPSPERVAAHKTCPATGTACTVERTTGECIGEGGACAIQKNSGTPPWVQASKTNPRVPAQIPATSEPWSPEQVLANKVNVLPPEVFWIVNRLLAERYDGMNATMRRKEVESRIRDAIKDLPFDPYWLKFETVYRDCGWNVDYHLPSEDCDGYWIFTAVPNRKESR